ncbi:MAG: hypothetical protein HY515_04245, partial [Candidatus Aenigmarchaeota archaeon]|nr:hypothetical protein [Candidatus Aenigmarchaeota archaeon]
VGNSAKGLKGTLETIDRNVRKVEAEKRKRREENKKFSRRVFGTTEEED